MYFAESKALGTLWKHGMGGKAIGDDGGVNISATFDGAALLTTGQMLAALLATILLTTAEVGCHGALREEFRMCVDSWQLVLLSGVSHFLAIISVNLALFHGTVTLVSIIKATELVFTAALSRVALGHKPSTKQASAGLLLIAGLVALCASEGGSNWGSAEGGAVVLALLSNVGNAARNVSMKGCVARGHDISSHVTLAAQSIVSLVILIGVFVPIRIFWGAWWDTERGGGDRDRSSSGGSGERGGDSSSGGLSAEAAEMWADAVTGLSASPGIFVMACIAFAVYLPTSQFVLRCCDSAVTHGVLNSTKRAAVVLMSVAALGEKPSKAALGTLAVLLVGGAGYGIASGMKKEKKGGHGYDGHGHGSETTTTSGEEGGGGGGGGGAVGYGAVAMTAKEMKSSSSAARYSSSIYAFCESDDEGDDDEGVGAGGGWVGGGGGGGVDGGGGGGGRGDGINKKRRVMSTTTFIVQMYSAAAVLYILTSTVSVG